MCCQPEEATFHSCLGMAYKAMGDNMVSHQKPVDRAFRAFLLHIVTIIHMSCGRHQRPRNRLTRLCHWHRMTSASSQQWGHSMWASKNYNMHHTCLRRLVQRKSYSVCILAGFDIYSDWQVIKLDPSAVGVWYKLGKCYHRMGKLASAKSSFDAALRSVGS